MVLKIGYLVEDILLDDKEEDGDEDADSHNGEGSTNKCCYESMNIFIAKLGQTFPF